MNTLEYELLCHLRRGYLSTLAPDEQPTWQRKKTGRKEAPRQFYLAKFGDNLVRPMDPDHEAQYGGGAGKELDDKMCALRSSSAMTFNILGNGLALFSGLELAGALCIQRGGYDIEYEYKAPTLSIHGGRPAHLDALLSSFDGDTVVACEMKLMEWLTAKPEPLKDKYLDASNYSQEGLSPDRCGSVAGQVLRSAAYIFSQTARRLNEAAEEGAFASYDYAQMFKHALGIYNRLCEGAFGSCEKVVLLNCVWNPMDMLNESAVNVSVLDQLNMAWTVEKQGFDRFLASMEDVTGLFQEKSVEFSIHLCSHADLIGAIDWTGCQNERELLEERYGGW